MNLQTLQEKISNAMTDADYAGDITGIDAWIVSTDTLNATQRLGIYRDSILSGMIKALELNFPVTQKIVGDEFFAEMAKQFIQQTPSRSPDLGDYGEGLSAFIQCFSPADQLPYLSDIAELEWHGAAVFNGQDSVAMDFSALQQVGESQLESLRFKLQTNMRLMMSNFPIDKIWQWAEGDSSELMDISHDPVKLMLWRPELEIRIERVSDASWQLLQNLLQGLTIKQCCENNPQAESELSTMAAAGWFSGFTS